MERSQQPAADQGGEEENLEVGGLPLTTGQEAAESAMLRAADFGERNWGGEDWVRVGLGAAVVGTWMIFVLGAIIFAWIHAWAFQSVLQVLGSGVTAILASVIGFYFGERRRSM